MKAIQEYLQSGHITVKNDNLTNLFVNGDVIRKSNYEDYVKFRDYKYRNVKYIKKEDLLNADFDAIFKALQKMFLEYGEILFICSPMKYTHSNFVSCCSISLFTQKVEVYNRDDNVVDIVNYFKRK